MWDLIVSVPDHCLSFYTIFHFKYILISTLFASFENSTATPGSFRENSSLNHRSPLQVSYVYFRHKC